MEAWYITKAEVDAYRARGWHVTLMWVHHGAGGYYLAWREDD